MDDFLAQLLVELFQAQKPFGWLGTALLVWLAIASALGHGPISLTTIFAVGALLHGVFVWVS